MARQGQRVLRNRTALLFALLFCTYEALARFIIWLRPSTPNHRDPIMIFGLIASVLITVSISIRSSFVGDRVIFGAAAGAFALWLLRASFLLNSAVIAAVNALVSLLWGIGAVVSLLLLIRWSARRGNRNPTMHNLN